MSEAKKDWEVTLSCTKKHDDTYLIRNVNKDQAKWIAENQNASPNFDNQSRSQYCFLIFSEHIFLLSSLIIFIKQINNG